MQFVRNDSVLHRKIVYGYSSYLQIFMNYSLAQYLSGMFVNWGKSVQK